MSKNKLNSTLKCSSCGQFISYNDIDLGKAEYEFIPDSEYTIEKIDHFCRKCNKKNNVKEEKE
jgi:hypothetical protein